MFDCAGSGVRLVPGLRSCSARQAAIPIAEAPSAILSFVASRRDCARGTARALVELVSMRYLSEHPLYASSCRDVGFQFTLPRLRASKTTPDGQHTKYSARTCSHIVEKLHASPADFDGLWHLMKSPPGVRRHVRFQGPKYRIR